MKSKDFKDEEYKCFRLAVSTLIFELCCIFNDIKLTAITLKPAVKKAFKILNYLVLTLVLLFVLLVAIINLPAVHKVITSKANQVLADAGIPVHIGKFTLLINGKIGIENVEIIATGSDTIIYAGNASVNFRPLPLLFKRVEIESIYLDKVVVDIKSDEKTGELNLVSVFSTDSNPKKVTKDTTKTAAGKPWEISLKNVILKNIRFSYFDQQGGISIVQNLKKAQFSFSTFSLLNQTIIADKITLDEPDGMVGIWASEALPEDEPTGPTSWKFALNKLNVSNLKFLLDQPESGTQLEIKLKEGNLSLKNLDLAEQKIETGEIELKQPEIDYISTGTIPETTAQEEETTVKIAFPELPWEIISEKILVADGSLNLKNETGETDQELEKWLPVSHLNFTLNTISLAPEKSTLNLEKLSAKIGTSIDLTSGVLSFEADSAQNINLKTNLTVAEITDRKKWFGNNREIRFNAAINGSLNDVLQISAFELKASSGLNFSVTGIISGLEDFNRAVCNFDYKTSTVSRGQVLGALSAFGIKTSLPTFSPFAAKGNISNTLQHPFMTLDFVSATGNIGLAGNYNTKTNETALKGDFRKVNLAQLFGESAPQNITGKIDIREKINDTGFPTGTAVIQIDSVFYNNKNIRDISLKINSEKNNAEYSLIAADTALFCKLNGTLKSEKSGYNGEIKGSFDVNPFALNFLDNPLELKGEIDGNFGFSKTKTVGNVTLEKLTVQNENKVVNLGNLQLEMASGDSLLFAKLRSAVLNVDFSSLATLQDFQKAFLATDLKNAVNLDSANFINLAEIGKLKEFRLGAKLNYHEIFQLFYPDTVLNFSDINILFGKKNIDSLVTARIETEKIKFGQFSGIRPLILASIETNGIDAAIETESITTPALQFGASNVKLNILPSEITGDLKIRGKEGEILYGIDLKAINENQEIKLVASPEWIINQRKWSIKPSQVLSWMPATKKLKADVNIFSDNMQIRIGNDATDSYKLLMKDVVLDSLVPNELSEFIPLGILNAQINYKTAQQNNLDYDLNFSQISWQNLAIDQIQSKGNIVTDTTGILEGVFKVIVDDSATMNLEMGSKKLAKGEMLKGNFETFPVKLIQPFIGEYVDQLKGTASGNIVFRENEKQMLFDGNIAINDVSMKIIPLQTTLLMPDNKLEIKSSNLIFNDFTVLDSLKKPMTLNGDINFSDTENMTVDLLVKTENLMLMNTTEKDNPEYFGTIVVNSGISIKGSLFSPEIRGNIVLDKGTEITYQMIQDLSVEANQTDVIFAGIDSTLNVIYPVTAEEKRVTQMPNIQTSIVIDPKSVFKVKIADIYNVDISIAGDGILNYNMLPNNTMSLNGIYEIRNGLCILKITGWPRKDFAITPASSFRWSGPIENPELNLEATTKVRGSYLNPIDNRNRNVDFIVSMRLENTLSNLGIAFNIKSEDQYISSVINSLSDDDLMRQAVNLLLFETIDIPGIQSSSNYMASQINSFWESQLNALTKTSFKKTDLSFGIDTYDENSAAGKQEKTSFTYQMERKFMNDRATIKLSGKLNDYEDAGYQTNSLFENFIFEYALDTLDSKFIKLYQKKDYEDMLEGEVIKFGVGFLYRKNYEKMKDIWQRKKKAKSQPEKIKE